MEYYQPTHPLVCTVRRKRSQDYHYVMVPMIRSHDYHRYQECRMSVGSELYVKVQKKIMLSVNNKAISTGNPKLHIIPIVLSY